MGDYNDSDITKGFEAAGQRMATLEGSLKQLEMFSEGNAKRLKELLTMVGREVGGGGDPSRKFWTNEDHAEEFGVLFLKACRKERDAPRHASNQPKVQQASDASVVLYRRGLYTWQQVDSILREIGEVEGAIRAETADRNRRILEAKARGDRQIEPLRAREVELFGMLDTFARQQYYQRTLVVKGLRFGQVRIEAGEITVEPKIELAVSMRGKP